MILLHDSEISSAAQVDYTKEFSVGITHLDFNNHVNNACYPRVGSKYDTC